MSDTRYAIYHLPEGPLGALGAAWLGWDAREGLAPARIAVSGLPGAPQDLTATPMRYGFHATLKAPFRLARSHSAEDLARRAELVCDHLAPFALDLELHSDWGFVMLRPRHQPHELMALEQVLVTRLDGLRRPLSPEDYERRQPHLLSEKARTHLDHWGYPHVLDLFNYHLTLSGSLPPETAVALQQALRPVFAPLIAQPMPVRAVALVAEDAAGRFRLLREIPLRGAAA